MKDFGKNFLVTCHTDKVGPDSTFVAIKGAKQDGANFIPKAIINGAKTIVVDQETVLSENLNCLINSKNIELIKVENTRQALSYFAAKAYNYCYKKLKIIGVTGTKGKTSTVFLIEHILKSSGHRTALLSTVKNSILNTEYSTNLTTCQPDYLHAFFDACVSNDIEYVIMEVAAQAVSLHRIDDIEFDALVFTNFSLEHSEFYKTQDDYFLAKCKSFEKLKSDGFAIFNYDENKILEFAKVFANSNINKTVKTFGLKTKLDKNPDFSGSVNKLDLLESSFTINNATDKFEVKTNLTGKFNLYNILAAVTTVNCLGIDTQIIIKALKDFKTIPGRVQKHNLNNGAIAVIDYAHNPSSFESVLSTLKEFTDNLIVVFGAGGDKDKTKRPIMGKIAAKYANHIILTSDNPRSENSLDIINDIKAGVSNLENVTIELDRELAIRKAYSLSSNGSIIALLGKGPDEYQIINNTKYPFSESAILATL